MQRRIVFCADDLGISPGTNAGIRAAVEAGLVREASFCVTGVAAEDGADIARQMQAGLSVGLHLTFTLGRALTGPLRGLTDDQGNFLPLSTVLRNCVFKKPEPEEVEGEIEAQLARMSELGMRPSHLNGHNHVHCFPVIREPVIRTMARWRIRWTRLPNEQAGVVGRLSPRRILLARFAKAFRTPGSEAPPMHLPFVGLSMQDRSDYRRLFLETLDTLPDGDYEWMVHPRKEDGIFERLDNLQGRRGSQSRIELEALTDRDFVSSILDRGARPMSFGDLDATGPGAGAGIPANRG